MAGTMIFSSISVFANTQTIPSSMESGTLLQYDENLESSTSIYPTTKSSQPSGYKEDTLSTSREREA